MTDTVTISDLSRGEYIPGTSGKVDFHKMKAAGVVASYFRAVDGQFLDQTYPTFKTDCQDILPWGAYGTIYPPATHGAIKSQAQSYCNAVNKNHGQLPLCIDWEVDGVTWQMADEWLSIVEQTFPGVEIINYTRAEYLATALKGCTKIARFQKLAVWQAQYGVSKPSPLPAGFNMIMWQFTPSADASLYGVVQAKELDLSYFYGTLDDFSKRFGITSQPPVITPPPARTITSVTVEYSDGTKEITIP